jgi:hypothetical protein
MTAQTYHADDGHLVHEHDQTVPENNLMEADADLAEPDTDLAESDTDLTGTETPPTEPDTDLTWTETPPTEPDTDLTGTETPLAEPDSDLTGTETPLAESDTDLAGTETPPSEPDADQTGHEDPTSQPADATALAGFESGASRVSDYPGFTADADDGAREPGMPDSSAGSSSLVTAAFTVPESAAESHPAGNGASAHGPWSEIQAMFVDDPRASIERAVGLVDDRIEHLIDSVRERQRSMQAAWQADDAGTEELRVALQHYRTFWNSLDDLPAQD